MITFLRKIRKSLFDSGSARKYVLYAIGEIALVVIGILIALQINNWNEEKKLLRQEALLLTEMAKNLKKDLTGFEQNLQEITNRVLIIEHLHDQLGNKNITYHDSLNSYFGAVYGVENIELNPANYEDLKSRGFDLIQNDQLRSQINQFFEMAIAKTNRYEISEKAVNEVTKPYYLQNFVEIDFKDYAVPINSEQLFNDNYYRNLVYYRMINLKSNQLVHHTRIIKGMKELIEGIEKYLGPDQ